MVDDDRHVSIIRIERNLYLLARSEALRGSVSFTKWVCEAIRQRLRRDVLRED